MIKTLHIFCLLITATAANASAWDLLFEDGRGVVWSVDMDSVVRKGENIEAWLKADYSNRVFTVQEQKNIDMQKALRKRGMLTNNGGGSLADQPNTPDEIVESKQFFLFNCSLRKLAMIQKIDYLSDGSVSDSWSTAKVAVGMQRIIPDTIGELWLNMTCARAALGKK